jgi:hypothetical protein
MMMMVVNNSIVFHRLVRPKLLVSAAPPKNASPSWIGSRNATSWSFVGAVLDNNHSQLLRTPSTRLIEWGSGRESLWIPSSVAITNKSPPCENAGSSPPSLLPSKQPGKQLSNNAHASTTHANTTTSPSFTPSRSLD